MLAKVLRSTPVQTAVVVTGLFAVACSSSPDTQQETQMLDPGEAAEVPEAEHPQDFEAQGVEPGVIPEDGVPGDGAEAPAGADGEAAAPAEGTETGQPDPSTAPPSATAPEAPDADAPPPPSAEAPASTAEELPASSEEVTATQIEEFAAVYIEVMELQLEYEPIIEEADDPAEARQMMQQFEQQAFHTVDAHRLTLDEFHAIAQLLEQDESLRDQVQSEVDEQALGE